MELIAETQAKQVREHIERCAYLIWEQEGRPVGRALEHWVQAEAELLGTGQGKSAPDSVPSETGANSRESPRRSRYGLVLTKDSSDSRATSWRGPAQNLQRLDGRCVSVLEA